MGQCSSAVRQEDGLHQARRESPSSRTGSLTASAINRLRRRRSTDAARQDPKRPRPAELASHAPADENSIVRDENAYEWDQLSRLPSARSEEVEPSLTHDEARSAPASEASSQEISSLNSASSTPESPQQNDFDAISDEGDYFDAPNELLELGDGITLERPPFLSRQERARIPPLSPPPSPPLPQQVPANSRTSSQRISHENETSQVSVLSRVLLAAATLTASHLVGEQLSHGEQYVGSSGSTAQHMSPNLSDSPPSAEQRSAQNHNPFVSRGSTHVLGRAASPGAESSQSFDRIDTSESNSEQGSRTPVTFVDFLEQLRSGRHMSELWQAMFDTNRAANFFRFFRFPEDGEGRIPILLMGIRSAENAHGHAPEQSQNTDSETELNQEGTDHRETDNFEFSVEPRNQGGAPSRTSEDQHQTNRPSHVHNNLSFDEDTQNVSIGSENNEDPFEEPGFSDEGVADADAFGRNTLIDALFNDLLNEPYNRGNGSRRQSETDDHNLTNEESSDYSESYEQNRGPESIDGHESDHASTRDTNGRGHHSWVIYVIGGAYPPNHPIFFAPSLLTDSPSYEDMLFIEQLLGPIKPPVASKSDVSSAGGIFKLTEGSRYLTERCPICLVDYSVDDVCRELLCKHAFHQDCVDSWLLKSHNSCPMCRHEGVPSHLPYPTRNPA